mgnify:FL=1
MLSGSQGPLDYYVAHRKKTMTSRVLKGLWLRRTAYRAFQRERLENASEHENPVEGKADCHPDEDFRPLLPEHSYGPASTKM